MARPLRIEFPGALYHVTSRGNARQPIFSDDKDRGKFLDILSGVVERFGWRCHGYCLMDNHYHLVIETPDDGNLSRGMRQLNGVYTQVFNQRNQTVGHLFQGRYKAILVEKDRYLLAVCRYVVLNPVRARMVKGPEGWVWSSYRATKGDVKRPSFLSVEWVLSQFGRERGRAQERYEEFVMEGVEQASPWAEVKGQIILGSEEYVGKLTGLLRERENVEEVPRVQRYAGRTPLGDLFEMKKTRAGARRDETIYAAYVRHGYTMKEIADHLSVHYATISRAIERVERGKEMWYCKT